MSRIRLALFLIALACPVPAAAQTSFGNPAASARDVLRIAGSTDTELIATLADAFSAAHPEAQILYTELSTSTLYEQARTECSAGTASADLLISSAMDLQVALANDGCSRPRVSPVLQSPPLPGNWRDEVFGLTREPAVLIYNKSLLAADEVPRTRFELIDLLRGDSARFTGRIALYDVRESGIGYLFAFEDSKKATTFGRLIETLSRLRVELFCCTGEMVEAVASGRLILGYNVLGSYAEAMATSNPTIGIVHFSDYSISISRAAVIPRHARNPRLAGLFLDFVQSPQGQAALRDTWLLPDKEDEQSTTDTLIPLSPVLLLGIDAAKRRSFLEQFEGFAAN